MPDKIRMKIYGVRGSYPPTTGAATRIGVNTTCLRVDIGKNVVVFDAGTGIINLGNDLFSEIQNTKNNDHLWKLHLFFTHSHIDHLMGFPYFLLNYMPRAEFHFLSPRFLSHSLEQILDFLMSPALFPVTLAELPSRRFYYEMGEGKVVHFYEDRFEIQTIGENRKIEKGIGKISCLRNYTHPKGGVYIYKIENSRGGSIVLATDIEGFVGGDQRLIKFAEGADILIHDAQYSLDEYGMFQGFGHSTYEMACEVAAKARVKKLLLFHHDPKHSDAQLKELQDAAQKIFPETFVASEDMEFSI